MHPPHRARLDADPSGRVLTRPLDGRSKRSAREPTHKKLRQGIRARQFRQGIALVGTVTTTLCGSGSVSTALGDAMTEIKITRYRPGRARGAGDLHVWASRRLVGRFGTGEPKDPPKKDAAARWLAKHDPDARRENRRKRERERWHQRQAHLAKKRHAWKRKLVRPVQTESELIKADSAKSALRNADLNERFSDVVLDVLDESQCTTASKS